MNASYADIVKTFNFIAHGFCRDGSFFGDGNVAGAGGHHSNLAPAVLPLIASQDEANFWDPSTQLRMRKKHKPPAYPSAREAA